MTRLPIKQDERHEQVLTVRYCQELKIKVNAINPTSYKPIAMAQRDKAAGLTAGCPDLMLIIPGMYSSKCETKLIFIEMKKKKGGTVSDEQKEWIKALNDCIGVTAYIAKGFDEAKGIIDSYIEVNKPKDFFFYRF